MPLLPASIALQPHESRSPATSCAPLQLPSDLFIAGEPSFAAASDDTSQRSGCPAANCRKPNYIEPAVGWNYEDQKTGLVKYGLTHWEPAEVKTIPAPVRPPVAFADEDADGYDPRDAEFLSQDPLEDMDCVAGLLE